MNINIDPPVKQEEATEQTTGEATVAQPEQATEQDSEEGTTEG